ncbi:DUF3667 domain-containing protein [Flavobacterium sp.]|jgi:hypothetical protein|uniref:DUF3667 domain-containing protein n=1 Tax=Flavobacterium sp. TaxID=239 RepID=UPI000A9BC513|nr:DUF3667 domain-containing protein [Flavobacterium sp.]
MKENCQNCNTLILDNFCSNCGQKSFKRINKKYIVDELQYTIIHTNKGFLYTLKKLAKNPGKTAREFIEGNRVHHYKPLSLLFILSTISALLMFKLLDMGSIMSKVYSDKKMNSMMMTDMYTFMSSYYSLLMMALIPVFAFCTWLILKNWGQNYYEHIIINSYVLSFYTLIYIVFIVPILYFLKNSPESFLNVSTFSFILYVLIYFWFFKGYYPEKSFKEIALNVVLIFLLIVVAYFAFILIAMILYMIYFAIAYSPKELLEYIKPTGKI